MKTQTSKQALKELRDLNEQDLNNKLKEAKEELFKLRFQRATGRVENPMKMRQVRREIAQIETLLNERARTSTNA